MPDSRPVSSPRLWLVALVGLATGLAGGVGGAVAVNAGWLPFAASRHANTQMVRTALLDDPDMLSEAVARLQQHDSGQQLAQLRTPLETAFPGAVLGNPQGKVTLVEFLDFACGYCRKSVADVDALVAANPDLKVVVRQLPILSPQSVVAARLALAAAHQGKYPAFHHALYAAGRPDETGLAQAAKAAGLDAAQARQGMNDPAVQTEIEHNLRLAQQLGLKGTPGFVVGDTVFDGAVGKEPLQQAIDAARTGGKAGPA